MTHQEATASRTQRSVVDGFRNWQGIDLLISFIGIASLGMHYSEINNSFFVSMAIIVMPVFTHLCVDYAGSKNKKSKGQNQRKLIYGIRFLITLLSGVILATCLLGYIGVLGIYAETHTVGSADTEEVIATNEMERSEIVSVPLEGIQSAETIECEQTVVYMAIKKDYMFFPNLRADVRVAARILWVMLALQFFEFFMHPKEKEEEFICEQLGDR